MRRQPHPNAAPSSTTRQCQQECPLVRPSSPKHWLPPHSRHFQLFSMHTQMNWRVSTITLDHSSSLPSPSPLTIVYVPLTIQFKLLASPADGAAIYAYRSGGLPTLRTLGITKLLTRYEGYVEAPKSYPKRQIPIAFEYDSPSLRMECVKSDLIERILVKSGKDKDLLLQQ